MTGCPAGIYPWLDYFLFLYNDGISVKDVLGNLGCNTFADQHQQLLSLRPQRDIMENGCDRVKVDSVAGENGEATTNTHVADTFELAVHGIFVAKNQRCRRTTTLLMGELSDVMSCEKILVAENESGAGMRILICLVGSSHGGAETNWVVGGNKQEAGFHILQISVAEGHT